MSTQDELRDFANDCTGLFSTFVPKQILRDAADRIDRLEAELAEARKDALMEAHRILSNSQSKPEALGKIDALQRLADQAQKLHMGY